MKILITGANGFLGSWLCQVATQEFQAEVYAFVRPNANIKQIENLPGVEIIKADYIKESLHSTLENLKLKMGAVDMVIHNAGLTKSTIRDRFFKINVGLTELIIEALKSSGILRGAFTQVSSEAALGPVGCNGPVSAYGESKLAAEKVVKTSGLNYMIFRPTGIYGPRDNEFLALFESVKKGIYPCAAPKKQKVTLIHGFDVAYNIIALSQAHRNKTVHLDDGNVYSHADMKLAIEKVLNKKSLMLVIPQGLTRLSLSTMAFLGKIFRFEPILTTEKHGEITKDWDHDFSLERKEIPLTIRYKLQAGFANTYDFYKSENLL